MTNGRTQAPGQGHRRRVRFSELIADDCMTLMLQVRRSGVFEVGYRGRGRMRVGRRFGAGRHTRSIWVRPVHAGRTGTTPATLDDDLAGIARMPLRHELIDWTVTVTFSFFGDRCRLYHQVVRRCNAELIMTASRGLWIRN